MDMRPIGHVGILRPSRAIYAAIETSIDKKRAGCGTALRLRVVDVTISLKAKEFPSHPGLIGAIQSAPSP
jgi:hypothetical protein